MTTKTKSNLTKDEQVLVKHFSVQHNATFSSVPDRRRDRGIDKVIVKATIPICHLSKLISFATDLGWTFKHCHASFLVSSHRNDQVTAFFHKGN